MAYGKVLEMKKPILLRADTPEMLSSKVRGMSGQGCDLYGGLIPGHYEMGQWVIQTGDTLYEYSLAQGKSFGELEDECWGLVEKGYDFFMHTVTWHLEMFQWMVRVREQHTRTQIVTAQGIYSEPTQALQMVESVSPLLTIIPVNSRMPVAFAFPSPIPSLAVDPAPQAGS